MLTADRMPRAIAAHINSSSLLAEAAARRAYTKYVNSGRAEWNLQTTRITDELFCYYDHRGWLVTIGTWDGQWLSTERV